MSWKKKIRQKGYFDLNFYEISDNFQQRSNECGIYSINGGAVTRLCCKDLNKIFNAPVIRKRQESMKKAGADLMCLLGAFCLHAFFGYWRTSD